MTEFKFITEYNNEIVFSYGNKRYIGTLLEANLAAEFRSSGIYHLNEAIIQGDLPNNLEGVTIDYLFEEKQYHMKWICYFNSMPSESDEETMSAVFGYVLGDMPNISNLNISFQTKEKFLHEPIPKPITNLQDWIFIRPK